MKLGRQRQIERIMANEARLNDGRKAVDELMSTLEWFQTMQEDIHELGVYYGSQEWFADKADQEGGKLPQDLKCGVLSEDAAYDLLTDVMEVRRLMTQILEEGPEIIEEEEEPVAKEMAEL
ncbi:MAG: DUF4298 domain-containing protein [Clostridiales bacterium]|nr:DUF4298 domain-containing protein [Clostridiales bacterium]